MNTTHSQILRQKLKEAVRSFFLSRAYQEVETPVVVVCPGTEVHLQYFKTEWIDHQKKSHELFLRSSPELHMKQLLAEGMHRIFQIAPCFRNSGEKSFWHHPEFTMIEWYEAGIDYHAFIKLTEDLIRYCGEAMRPVLFQCGISTANLPSIFEKITITEAFKTFAKIDLIDNDPALARKAIAEGVFSVNDHDDFETAFFKILIEKIEPVLATKSGTVLYDYPPSQAALATVEHGIARRFEFYVGRTELSNGFKELLGEADNRKRIANALSERQKHGYNVPSQDEDFYSAMSKNIPECCGNALGFDRLLALICGLEEISSIIPFRSARVWSNVPDSKS
jgi:lysyl-tRNA synthetase class 2